MVIHTENRKVIQAFGLEKPVSRLLVNTPAALGGIGETTNLVPALTLGCGSIGGSSTSDNIGPQHLFNLRRVAYGTTELEEIRSNKTGANEEASPLIANEELINTLVSQILARLQ